MKYSIDYLNEKAKNPTLFIEEQDDSYIEKIAGIAKYARENCKEKPVILVSGPSGSGKTTTALILEKMLDDSGHETLELSLDNFFRSCTDEERRLSALGKFDLESPNLVDKDFLASQLNDLMSMKTVRMSAFDFVTQQRYFTDETYKMKPGELILLEGIHALNPDVVQIPDEQTIKIYVSVRSRIEYDGGVLHPSKIRLLRRMLRDNRDRGKSFEKTYKMFQSVQHGENAYIMPYKNRADFHVDTFHAYELGIYRSLIFEDLLKCDDKISKLAVVNVLSKIDPISPSYLKENSMINEFAMQK